VTRRKIFKELRILPFYCQYIFSILLFVIKNNEIFLTNSEIHSICTRHTANLHPPLLHLTKAQKGVYFFTIKIYNILPQRIKKLSGDAYKFKVTLKKFLLLNSIYSLEEYFAYDTKFDPDKN
jgi:hypothetical protein